MLLCPDGAKHITTLQEIPRKTQEKEAKIYHRRRKFFANISYWWESLSFSLPGSLLLCLAAPFSLARLTAMGIAPRFLERCNEIIRQNRPQTEFSELLDTPVAARLLANTFKDVGTHNRFAPLVVVMGHGASSANNPFTAAYNCGACGGREGGPNARLFSRLANNAAVREELKNTHGIVIPSDTIFVGAQHNTTADTIEYFDEDLVPETHHQRLSETKLLFNRARADNALERCIRFLLAKNVDGVKEALLHVHQRATDPAEIRPELNHATNAAVIVGRRSLTKGCFFDRRSFLVSYDPYSDDDEGHNLEHVLAPALIVASGINLEYFFSTVDTENHGAGSKSPMNVTGNIGVLFGTVGDLRPGLPWQMTEMHIPIRAHFVIDARIERLEQVLKRRNDLRQLVRNEWVHLTVRDPNTGQFYKQSHGNYILYDIDWDGEHIPAMHWHHVPNEGLVAHKVFGPGPQLSHGHQIAKKESLVHAAAVAAIFSSCALPIYFLSSTAMNPLGTFIAIGGTLLALPVLCYSRRYLHGELMFIRFSALSVAMVLAFNLLALSPSIHQTLGFWGLFGFASTFLIGAYNQRASVRNNAIFAFAAYRISDFAMLTAATFAPYLSNHGLLVAGCLLLSALYKSSQFPLTGLFARSMEGVTPTSALGYAGLSAHAGIVLLSSTIDLWFPSDIARSVLALIGLYTAFHGSMVSKIRADRKGAIAYATSATIGLIYLILAAGYPGIALSLSFGHAAYRMVQILRATNALNDSQRREAALGQTLWPRAVSDWQYRLAWSLRRIDSDFHLINVLNRIFGSFKLAQQSWHLPKISQWLLTAAIVIIAGLPFTPFSHWLEEYISELLLHEPLMAFIIMLIHFTVSVLLLRVLFAKVISRRRFHRDDLYKHHHHHPPPSIPSSPNTQIVKLPNPLPVNVRPLSANKKINPPSAPLSLPPPSPPPPQLPK